MANIESLSNLWQRCICPSCKIFLETVVLFVTSILWFWSVTELFILNCVVIKQAGMAILVLTLIALRSLSRPLSFQAKLSPAGRDLSGPRDPSEEADLLVFLFKLLLSKPIALKSFLSGLGLGRFLKYFSLKIFLKK